MVLVKYSHQVPHTETHVRQPIVKRFGYDQHWSFRELVSHSVTC